jgi:pimeloyl-ACP methyl ester carboxylesterase
MIEPKPEEKPLALLIPGLDGTGELFYRQTESLARRYRVCAWKYGPGADGALADLTRSIGAATESEPPHSVLVVGESFGGLVALDYVLRYGVRVRRLILVNTFPYYRRRLRVRLLSLLTPLLRLTVARRLKECVVDRILSGEGVLPEDRRRFHEIVSRIQPEGYIRRLQIIMRTDLRPRLQDIAVPVVLLASGRDKVVPSVSEARFMAVRIPCARVYEFPEAGHALLQTAGISLLDYD